MSNLPTLEKYDLSANVYSSFKAELEKLQKTKDGIKPLGFLAIGIFLIVSFLLLSLFTNYNLWKDFYLSVAFTFLFFLFFWSASEDFWANVFSHGRFRKIEKQIEDLIKNTHSKVEPFENALYDYSTALLDQHYENKLYKKHSGTPAFEEALSEFESMIDTAKTLNSILLTKHLSLQNYENYLNSRRIGHYFRSAHNVQKTEKLSKEFSYINDLVKKVKQKPSEKIIHPPEELYRVPRKVDWESINKDKKITGDQGEEIAVAIEREYLKSVGREELANEIRHVSKEDGDGLGYDILSFFPDGREKFIEVKSTKQKIETPFYLSRGEYSFIKKNAQNGI